MVAFFTPWETWEKLTFALGCAIVLVFIAASVVRLVKNRAVKGHARRIAEEQAERGEVSQVLRHSEEIPFGIRAIEQGLTVEGVWNSKATTPLQTPPPSQPPSPLLREQNKLKKNKRDSSCSSVSALDISEPSLATPAVKKPRIDSAVSSLDDPEAAGCSKERPVSPESLQETPMRGRPAYQPGRVNSNGQPAGVLPHVFNHQRAHIEPFHGAAHIELGQKAAPDSSVAFPQNSGSPAPPLPARSQTASLGGIAGAMKKEGTVPSPPSESLESMDAHRQSHAAEMGQLLPRAQRGHWRSAKTRQSATTQSERGVSSFNDRAVSWPLAGIDHEQEIMRSTAPPPPKNPKSTTPASLSAAENEQPSRPTSGNYGSRRQTTLPVTGDPTVNSKKPCPPSAWTERIQEAMDEKTLPKPVENSQERETSASTTMAQTQTTAIIDSTNEAISHHNTTSRKVNPGFEVLPAGTLENPSIVKDFGYAATPPPEERRHTRRPSKKLQKRDRSRSSGTRSASSDDAFHPGQEYMYENCFNPPHWKSRIRRVGEHSSWPGDFQSEQ